MAQTKTSGSRSKSASSRSRSGPNSKRSNGGSPKSSTRRTTSASSGRSSGSKGNRSRASSTRSRKASTSRSSTRQSAGRDGKSTIGTIAAKAKGPAVAGGAALVGLAGGIALTNRNRKRGILDRIPTPSVKRPNVSMPKLKPDDALKRLGEAAGTVAQRSRQVGDVATEVQKASDAINKKR
jgi:hypothetical protein